MAGRHPWEVVSLSWFYKYDGHRYVTSAEVLNQGVEDGRLVTTRLLTINGMLPLVLRRVSGESERGVYDGVQLIRGQTLYVLETSVVSPGERHMAVFVSGRRSANVTVADAEHVADAALHCSFGVALFGIQG